MIGSLRSEQRRDLGAFADGIQSLVRGDDSLEAEAAAMNLAELAILWRKSLTGEK
jgi:hypothetical protein